MKYKLISFDMDGVIFEGDNFWMRLHSAFGTLEEGKKLTDKYLKTDYKRLVKEVVERLWKGRDAAPYFELIENTEYIPGVKEAVAEIKRKGMKTVVISSGPRHLMERALNELGIDYGFSNDLVIKDGKIAGEFVWPIGFGNKIEMLRSVCDKEGIDFSEVLAVGDDDNDVEKAKAVGFSIAFNSKSDELKSVCNVVIKKKDLREILAYLE